MARQQRFYEVTGYPTGGAGHTATVWTGPLPTVEYAWIDADPAAGYSWPAGTQFSLATLLTALEGAGYSRAYALFRGLHGRSSNFVNP